MKYIALLLLFPLVAAFGQSTTQLVDKTTGAWLSPSAALIKSGNGIVVSVKEYGAVGNNINDDTSEIQAALDSKKSVYFPAGTYRISAPIRFKGAGQIIRGDSPWKSIINQVTTSEDAVVIDAADLDDAVDQGNDLILSQRIEDIAIRGVGLGTSTGNGILGTGPNSWNGDWLSISNVTVRGFDVGILLEGVGQVSMHNTLSVYNNTGLRTTGGAVNSYRIGGLVTANGEIGVDIQSGSGGNVFQLGDCVSNNVADVSITSGGGTFIGGNFESSLRCFDIATNCGATIIGARFLRTGSAVAPIRVAANGSVSVYSTAQAGQDAGTHLVEKSSTTALVTMGAIGSSANNMGSTENEAYSFSDNSQTFRGVPWPSRYFNSVPTASSGLRGMLLNVVGNSSGDYMGQYLLDNGGRPVMDEWSNYRLRLASATSSASVSSSVNTLYRATGGSLQTFTLPSAATVDDEITIIGVGAGLWRVAQNSGQQIRLGASLSTSGAAGYIGSASAADWVRLKCTATDTSWQVVGYGGNITTDVAGRGPFATSGAVTGSGATMSTARLLGRTTASTGAIEELTAGSNLSLAAGSLSVSTGTSGAVIPLLNGNNTHSGTFRVSAAGASPGSASVTVSPTSGNGTFSALPFSASNYAVYNLVDSSSNRVGEFIYCGASSVGAYGIPADGVGLNIGANANQSFTISLSDTANTVWTASGMDVAGTITSGSANTVLTNATGTLRGAALDTNLGTQLTTTGNVGAGDDDLFAITVPANTLSTNGQSIHVRATGAAAAGQSVTVSFELGSTSTLVGAITGPTTWHIDAVILRTGAATQRVTVNTIGFTPSPAVNYFTVAEDLTTALALKVTGESLVVPVDNDVTLTMAKASFVP